EDDGQAAQTVDLSPYVNDDTNELSDLNLDGSNVLTLTNPATGGNSVDLSDLVGSDDQDATEVNLNSAVDVDGDGNDETTVQQAIEDIAAVLAVPTIYATGKVVIDYMGTPEVDTANSNLYGASVGRIDEGDYEVTFDTALSSANYIIQVATIDCDGDCPGNGSQNYDDPGITYYNQATTGFMVNIGDSDNGTTQKDDIDLEFMFTVIVIP
ncbi:MAG: hypothetical protein AAGC45_08485, partial [Bacteroidota bacterium]